MTDRRGFLSSAAATVYTLAAPRPVRARALAAADRLNVGFIGVGIRGSQLMQEFSKVDGVNFVAAADLYDGYLKHASEFTGGKIATGKRYEEILERKDIDAVVIATPDHLHKRMTLDALAAGKHVYIEKPLTWAVEEGPEIIAAEKRSGKVLVVGSGQKTSALTAKARELIAAKAIGKVHQVRMVNHRNSREGAWIYPIPPDASEQTIDWPRFLGRTRKRPFNAEVFFRWRCWWEYSGGVATDLFVHMLTTLHEILQVQAPRSAVSQGGLWFWQDGRTVPDVLESVFEYQEGFIVQCCVNLRSTFPAPNMVILGSDGALVMDRQRLILHPEPADRDVQAYGSLAWPKAMRDEYLKTQEAKAPARQPRPEPKEVAVERGPGHAELFVRSIRENKPSLENATEGHAAAGGAHIANRAYREGRRIRWDFPTNRVSAG
jgi:predicted dehydrogenase